MKHVKLFEAFVNEAKVNARAFAMDFSDFVSQIEEEYDFEEDLSTANMLYMLGQAWAEVAEQNNFDERMSDLTSTYAKFNIKTDSKFMRANLSKEARAFGAHAYGYTGYGLEGMIECFGAAMDEFGLVKPADWNKMAKYIAKL